MSAGNEKDRVVRVSSKAAKEPLDPGLSNGEPGRRFQGCWTLTALIDWRGLVGRRNQSRRRDTQPEGHPATPLLMHTLIMVG